MKKKYEKEYEKPVVLDKKPHHRAVQSFHIPGDPVTYYKAQDGENTYLVPKENLEAMKELVNYKMRRRADSKFTKATDPQKEKKELERYNKKLQQLSRTIGKFEKTELKPLEEEYKKRSKSSSVKENKHKESPVPELTRLSPRKTVEDTRKSRSLPLETIDTSTLTIESPKRSQSMSEEIVLSRGSVSETQTVKFLISGHFRNNKKPIFIVRQYQGSSVIGRRKSDFNSTKTENDVDIFISGKFFEKGILEEVNDRPKSIKFIHRKKIVIDSQSSILEEGFIELFSVSELDIVIGGMFIKSPTEHLYTPLISMSIKRPRHSRSSVLSGRFSSQENRAMVMSVSTPLMKNPFAKELRKTRSAPKEGFHRRQKGSSAVRESKGFVSLLTRIDEEEEKFECPPARPKRSRSPSRVPTCTENGKSKENVKPRASSLTIPKIFSFHSLFPFMTKENPAKGDLESRKPLRTRSKTVSTTNSVDEEVTKGAAKNIEDVPDSRTTAVGSEAVNFPGTSQSTTALHKAEDNLITLAAPLVPEVAKSPKKPKSSKKPGFFRRIFKRLFSK